MDRLAFYHQTIQTIQTILTDYHNANLKAESQVLESQLVFDQDRDQYLLLLMGWEDDRRLKSVLIHVRIHQRKIWIEEDWTEEGVATDLLAAGLSRDEIVLGFHPPQVRQYTEFAVVPT